jgi:hypothetical protein
MKVNLHFKKNTIDTKYHEMFIKFVNFLQKEIPLENGVDIYFLGDREVQMSTGSRHSDSKIYVLASKRMNRDILRTIAHEWVHEYQMSVLGRKQGPNIGGRNEDEANALAGNLVKIFEELFPNYREFEYE